MLKLKKVTLILALIVMPKSMNSSSLFQYQVESTQQGEFPKATIYTMKKYEKYELS